MHLLQDESELDEIVRLVGMDALSSSDRLKMEAARSIREDFLHQLAFHEIDTHSSLHKQDLMMKLVLLYYDKASDALEKDAAVDALAGLPVRERIGRFKYIPEDAIDGEYEQIGAQLEHELANALKKEAK